MDLYVYYEVPRDAATATVARVRALQALMAGAARSARLLRRADPRVGPTETWMEVYEDASPEVEARLAALVEAHGLAGATGPRHVERFEAIA